MSIDNHNFPNPKSAICPFPYYLSTIFKNAVLAVFVMYLFLTYFSIQYNFFASIFSAFSRLKRLKKLNLDSNNITEVKAFAFKGLSDLIEISLQNNPIKVSKPQCENFIIFLSLRFYVKSIFGIVKVRKALNLD